MADQAPWQKPAGGSSFAAGIQLPANDDAPAHGITWPSGGHLFWSDSLTRLISDSVLQAFSLVTNGGVTIGGYVALPAIAAGAAPNNSIFRDSADNIIKRKDNTGAVAAI
jgi:hypothetical protein